MAVRVAGAVGLALPMTALVGGVTPAGGVEPLNWLAISKEK
ncbi:hypothetical protein [Streptomyces sp. BA2]|nr:hypothetical protein [Streptomyces sp. BA2]